MFSSNIPEKLTYLAGLGFVCNSMFLLLLSKWILMSNVHNLYYSDENGVIFILHVFAYLVGIIVFIVCEDVIIKLINVPI
jgi:hypothetical protein